MANEKGTMTDKPDILKAADELNDNIESLGKSLDQSFNHIEGLLAANRRLRAENIELRLKVQNLQYFIKAISQGRMPKSQ